MSKIISSGRKNNAILSRATEETARMLKNFTPASLTNFTRRPQDRKITTADKKYIDARLNLALKHRILESLAASDESVLQQIAELPVDYTRAADLPLEEYIKKEILPQLRSEREGREELLSSLSPDANESVKDILHLETPLLKNPLFADEARITKIDEYARLSGLQKKKTERIQALLLDPSDFDIEHLEKLAQDKAITEKEKNSLYFVFEAAKLGNDNPPLITSLQSASIHSLKELTAWERNDWLDFLKEHKIAAPDNVSQEEYADNIIENLEKSFPSEFLLRRAVRYAKEKIDRLDRLSPLLKNNPGLFSSTGAEEIDWKEINANDRASIEEELAEARGFVNYYKHLGLASILADTETRLPAKKQQLRRKIELFENFIANNRNIDLRTADFFDSEEMKKINWKGLKESDKNGIRKQLMAYQRVMLISDTPETGEKLIAGGFDSAGSIMDIDFNEFKTKSRLPEAEARRAYSQAGEIMAATSHVFEAARLSLKDVIGNKIGPANWELPDYTNQLKEIDGFDDLFGSQDYCDCEHCRSIFSPAAYFTDLMYFIQKNVSDKVFKTRPKHALYLKNRRPDLWKLQLSCKNTNTLIPYLDVVNKVLEEYLKRALSISDVYKRLNTEQISFNLPFNLYLEELRTYLTHFSITLFQIFRTLKNTDDETWREGLNITPEEWLVITTPDITNNVRKRIGDPAVAVFNKFDVKDFIRFAGITRAQLDELLNISFSGQLKPISIIKEQSADPQTDPLINYVERLANLTNERLDFIHRFIRLWRKTGWTIREFDLILATLKANSLLPATSNTAQDGILDKEAILICARLVEIQEQLKLKTEELPALYGALPQTSVKDNQEDFFTRTFNDRLFGAAGSITFHHSFINNDGVIDPKLGFLQGGLGIAETELVRLFELLNDEIIFDASGNTTLHREQVSLLYRHARLAKALKLSIDDFILLLKLLFTTGKPWVDSIDRVFELMAFKQKLQSIKLKVADLWFILKGEEKGSAIYKTASAALHSMVYNLQAQQIIYFDSAALSEIAGIDPGTSIKFVQQMEADGLAVKKSAGENLYRLTHAYQLSQDLTPIFSAIGAGPAIAAMEPDIRSKFAAYHSSVILREQFGKLLNLTPGAFDSLLSFIAAPSSGSAVYQALYAEFDDTGAPLNAADLLPLENLAKEFDRVVFLFGKMDCKEENILFIAGNLDVFGITNPIALSIEHFIHIAEYKKLAPTNAEKQEQLHALLKNYQSVNSFTDEELVLLSETWKADKNLLGTIVRFIPLPSISMEAIGYAGECLNICKTLGINGESLVKLKETGFDQLRETKDIIIGSFASKYPEEKERVEKLEPYHDKVNTKKRDALCDFILAHNKELKFKDRNDLYAYFLLDVEMSGCFRTSWLVAAISSLQLYIHRCLMNLEQAAIATVIPDGNNDPYDDAYEFVKVAPDLIPRDEWEWRKNYRVWEANRKVFLYPENYILPELRDNKSPIFKELEDELLQQKITKQSAEAAYQKYLSRFAELARMKIAGSYFHEDSNTYYFFGKTSADPPEFYYRKWVNQKTWTPWEKIELGINSTHVSAIIYAGKLYLFWTEVKVQEKTSISGGSSSDPVYPHKLEILYASLDENNKWSTPQRFLFGEVTFPGDYTYGERLNRKTYSGIKDGKLYIFYSDADFVIGGLTGHRRIDLFNNKMLGSDFGLIIPAAMKMTSATDLINLKKTGSTIALIAVKEGSSRHEARVDDELVVSSSSAPSITSSIKEDIYQPELRIVGRKNGDFVLRVGNQQYLVKQRSSSTENVFGNIFSGAWIFLFSPKWRLIRISTSLPDKLGEKLFMEGLDKFLSLKTQQLTEDILPFTISDITQLGAPFHNSKHIDFTGAYGEYYRELFFHIPFLIASHLNADQKFKEADWWYRKIFDPTAAEITNPAKDRNWQYIEFRGLSIKKLQAILTDSAAIEAYKKDPFNPHAIARLRLNAYQKTIVMKYIDNLLDWGDYLFAQDTMESINEATMLYILAYDILGKRPVKLGKCKTAGDSALTYDNLGPAIGKGSEFLIQLENYSFSSKLRSAQYKLSEAAALNDMSKRFINEDKPVYALERSKTALTDEQLHMAFEGKMVAVSRRRQYEKVERYDTIARERIAGAIEKAKIADLEFRPFVPPHIELIRGKVLAFCIPHNEELLKYWDRVEDRLFKIRHCMNISGVRRQLALFQPPIDPMMLVKARAAGLSIEDILAAMNKPLPPYRFGYLIEKAKQFAQTIQTFGAALLSALEKKDVEELAMIRSVNEREILQLTTQVRKQAIQEAQNQYLALEGQEANAQTRIEHFKTLIDDGLTGWEITQQVSRHTATAFKIAEGSLHMLTGIYYLIPNAGSPFAMTYGGEELGNSGAEFAQWTSSMASVADAISNSAGLEATFQRREEEWKQELKISEQEIKTIQKQMLAADLRVKMAERDLETHEKNIEHNKEIEDFYKNKFTNLGLYNYLSTTLTRLYREAYNIAYDMAKLTEQVYQLERDDDNIFIASDNWQFDKAGMLAGEKLLLQLQRLEKAYIENHLRDYEVSQSISMHMLAPGKLIELKQRGSCSVDIPELAYDFFYPGQYNRVIKSVRVSIPCVAGPYTNISCKLSLTDSQIRKEPSADAELISVPVQKLTSIATSNAQNDGGVFELNFRDERYLPFEGAGAISSWRLDLPSKIRAFDYNTISDVLFHISYTAKEDGTFRETVENGIETAITDFATSNGLFRLFSLKYHFPEVLHKLVNANVANQEAELELLKNHFPYMFSGKDITASNIKVYLKPIAGEMITTAGLTLKIGNFSISSWSDFPADPSLQNDLKLKEGSADINGPLIRKWIINAGNNGLKKEEIDDIMIVMKYTIG
ncbi:MAG TPA: neuraminidase-like domain-containing protein [Flavitalea sp.]|nr:neuraminidase-like domain-containing protein [Flavitalea sp.]